MGNQGLMNCCENPKPTTFEFTSIIPSKMHAVVAIQDNIQGIRQTISRVSFLSELDSYILKIKHSKQYQSKLAQQFESFDNLLDSICYQDNHNWDVPIQTKTYEQKKSRFDETSNSCYPFELGILCLQSDYLNQGDMVFLKNCNIKKIERLLLQKQFKSYRQQQFIKLLFCSLRQWQGLQNWIWTLEQKQSYRQTTQHLLYNLNRYINFINSEVSINDVVKLAKIRYFYQYFLHQVASKQIYGLEEVYFADNWVHEAEILLFQPNKILILHNFTSFSPYLQDLEADCDDTLRLNPPKGDEQIPKIKIKLVIKPLKKTQTGVKFRKFENLYYLPFTIFKIQNVQEKHGLYYISIREIQQQKIIKYLQSNIIKQVKKEQKISNKDAKTMMNELCSYREQYSKKLQDEYDEQIGEADKQSLEYYKRYIKNRVVMLLSEQEIPTLSKKQMQLCEDDVQVKIDQEITHQEIESQPDQVLPSHQQRNELQKQLAKYLKRLDFQKLQNQIDNVDIFINLKTLNISQSWLQKLQCLHCFPNLIQLFAYSNQIKKIEGLERNSNLRLLSLARNNIEILQNMSNLTHLRELYLTKNKLGLESALYLTNLKLSKLKILTISFKNKADECFETIMFKAPPKLKKLLINEGQLLTNRTKNTLKRRLKGVEIEYVRG